MSWRPLPRAPEPTPLRVGLDATLRHLRAPAVDVTTALFDSWISIIGADIAQHATPIGIDDGVLSLAAVEPAWASQLKWLEHDLIARIDQAVGAGVVTAIVVRLRPG